MTGQREPLYIQYVSSVAVYILSTLIVWQYIVTLYVDWKNNVNGLRWHNRFEVQIICMYTKTYFLSSKNSFDTDTWYMTVILFFYIYIFYTYTHFLIMYNMK